MKQAAGAAERVERATAALVARELAALGAMTGDELAARFEEVLGFPARTRNRVYLRKRLAWAIQAKIEGGLSERALKRIEELKPFIPERWMAALAPGPGAGIPAPAAATPAAGRRGATGPSGAPPRDPRLPAPGTVVTRVHAGVEHRVAVLPDGFEFQERRYRSLSAVARAITGVAWNGFTFFFGRAQGTRKAG